MSVRISRPALNLRDMLARLAGLEQHIAPTPPVPLAYDGNGSTTGFACSPGYRPVVVWLDGVMQREGAGGAYSTSFNGFVHHVVFAAPPAAAARVDILQWRA